MYPFGFGLSYTEFKYSELFLKQEAEQIKLSCQVTNIGKMDGDEVVQVYIKLPDLPIPTAIKQLKGFKRIHINKGKSETVEIEIEKSDLRYWDESVNHFVTPKGVYQVMVGTSSSDIRLSGMITL